MGDDPETNLAWTAVGYNTQTRTYPEAQRWRNSLTSATREKAQALLDCVPKMRTLRAIHQSPMAQQLMAQLQSLLQSYAAGDLLHGPLLAYCYVTGDAFYTHTEGSISFLMPKFRLERPDPYNCYEHVTVACAGIERLLQAFGCLDVPTVNVTGSTVIKP